jgi:hypothetical protein
MARKYARDNRGRFSSAGATARGGRLRTAAGNKRATVTKGIAGGKPAGAIKGKVKRDPGAAGKIGASKPKATAKSANRPDSARDTAVVNIPMRGARGKALDAEITRNVNAQKAASRAASKARNRKFKSEQSRAKKLRDVHVGAIAKSKGMSKKQVESALQAQTPSTQIKALKNWVKQNRAAAKPAAAKPKASAQDLVNASVRKNQNKKLRSLNDKINAAGPSAAGLRLEKLALQSRMTSTRPKPSAKQQAKQQAQNAALRSRVGRLKRAQARFEATADTRNVPGSKMIRRPDAKTSRGNRRAEQARSIYLGASALSVKNFGRGVARTPRAKNNWRPMRRG